MHWRRRWLWIHWPAFRQLRSSNDGQIQGKAESELNGFFSFLKHELTFWIILFNLSKSRFVQLSCHPSCARRGVSFRSKPDLTTIASFRAMSSRSGDRSRFRIYRMEKLRTSAKQSRTGNLENLPFHVLIWTSWYLLVISYIKCSFPTQIGDWVVLFELFSA